MFINEICERRIIFLYGMMYCVMFLNNNNNSRGAPGGLLQKPRCQSSIRRHAFLPFRKKVAHIALVQHWHRHLAQIVADRIPISVPRRLAAQNGHVADVLATHAMPIAAVVASGNGNVHLLLTVVSVDSR